MPYNIYAKPQPEPIDSNSEVIASPLLTDNILTPEDAQRSEEQQNAKQQLQSQSRSMALFNREINLSEFRQSHFNSSHLKSKENTKKRTQSQIQSFIQSFMSQTAQQIAGQKITDQVTVSTTQSKTQNKINTLRLTSPLSDPKITTIFSQFIHQFAEDVISEGTDKQKKSTAHREQLMQLGVSPKQIKVTEHRVQQLMHNEFKQKIRHQFLNLSMLCESKQNFATTLYQDYQQFESLSALGEASGVFGEGRSSLKSEREAANAELHSFIAQELDSRLTQSKLNSTDITPLKNSFNQLNNLINMSGFDANAYIQTVHRKIDQLGLAFFVPVSPHHRGQLDTDKPPRKRRKTESNDPDLADTESDYAHAESHVQSLIIARTTTPSLRRRIQLSLQLFKAKSKLSQFPNGGNLDTVVTQARQLSKLKLMALLKTAFEERATLPELAGPQFQIIRRQIRFIIKQLKSLGVTLSKFEYTTIRDQANRAMFTLQKDAYNQLEVQLATDPKNTYIIGKINQFVTILNRLKTETQIHDTIKEKLMQDMSFLSEISIVEGA